MKIRLKITLWITGAGLLVCLLFSLITFLEMEEQPYEMVDRQLAETAGLLSRLSATATLDDLKNGSWLDNYWIMVLDHQHRQLFISSLASRFDLPNNTRGAAGCTVRVPGSLVHSGQARAGHTTFRVRTLPCHWQGAEAVMVIGRPVEHLREEIAELLVGLGVGLGVATLLLIGLAYVIAGRILEPVKVMTALARRINEHHLDERIPTGPSRDELSALADELNRMFDRLHISFTRQQEFLAAASHELKSPVTMLHLSLEEMVQEPSLNDELREKLQRHDEILHRMDRLIRSLLELSRLESLGAPMFEVVDLAAIMDEVRQEYEMVCRAAKLTVEFEVATPLPVAGEPDSLQRLCINLLENAIRYNQPRGRIEIALHRVAHQAELVVGNTGPGIPAGDLERVFDQFYRVEKSRSRQLGGSGLGLSLVKQIVSLHGGTIRVESELGGWTRFIVRLPLAVEPADRGAGNRTGG